MFCGVNIHGDAPAIVLHPDHIVPFNNYQYIVAVALHGLIDRIINDLKYQMMETV
jgi:hypothetical protein